jgi:hypothetical protein
MGLFIAILIHIIGPVKLFDSAKAKLRGAALVAPPFEFLVWQAPLKKAPQEKHEGKQTLQEINSSVFLSFVVSYLF